MTLDSINRCHVCDSSKLIPRFNIIIPNLFTDEEEFKDVLQCEDCDTIHYISDGKITYDFICNKIENINHKKIKESK